MENILVLDSTTTTNKIAYDLAEKGAIHGFSVIAKTQTRGRGRLGREWLSVPGKGLYCSIIVRPQLEVADYPKITMTAGLGVVVALEKLSGITLHLKWPNDIYCSGKKCCGILSESSPLTKDMENRFAIVGIGINVNTEESGFSKEIVTAATSLFIETGKSYDLNAVFSQVREEVLRHIEELETKGFAHILQRWKAKDVLQGKWLEWVTHSGEIVYGKSEGPDESGQLLVRDQQGKVHEVISGDIRLVDNK